MRIALAAATASLCALGALELVRGTTAAAQEEKPYRIEGGRVDRATFNGYRRYGNSCLACHGPDGAGSSYGPSMVESLKRLTRDEFNEIVINGRQNVTTAQQNVMPAFGLVEDVVLYLDDIYGYLKARSDGALGRGRPERLDN